MWASDDQTARPSSSWLNTLIVMAKTGCHCGSRRKLAVVGQVKWGEPSSLRESSGSPISKKPVAKIAGGTCLASQPIWDRRLRDDEPPVRAPPGETRGDRTSLVGGIDALPLGPALEVRPLLAAKPAI